MKTMLKRFLGPELSNLRFAFGAPLAFRLGHFYSPITAPEETARFYRDPDLTPPPESVAGIDLGDARQVALWEKLAVHAAAKPLDPVPPGSRYSPDNDGFNYGDGTILACMISHFRPKRLVEIGCGHSSALALDTIDRQLGGQVAVTFVEPYPALLKSVLRAEDFARVTIIDRMVQETDIGLFASLEAGDILFIDTSHVAKTCSDVLFEVFDILPALKPGVIVHFHDIVYPFEYPRRWAIDLNYAWNEIYILRAFLMYNNQFEIIFFNDYMKKIHNELLVVADPRLGTVMGSGLWLTRR